MAMIVLTDALNEKKKKKKTERGATEHGGERRRNRVPILEQWRASSRKPNTDIVHDATRMENGNIAEDVCE